MNTVLITIDRKIEESERANIRTVLEYLAGTVGLKLIEDCIAPVGIVEIVSNQGDLVSYNLSNTTLRGEVDHIPQLKIILTESVARKSAVEFACCDRVPAVFRGRSLCCEDYAPIVFGFPQGEVVATVNGQPAWIVERKDGVRYDTVFLPKPWISRERRLFEHLKGHFIFRLLPVIEWLRSLSDWHTWKKPPMRASIMFDDPNFHWKTYGFLSFASLARLAEKHNLGVSFATIPLDLFYTNKKVVQRVINGSSRLSFLCHGITHSFRELNSKEEASMSAKIKWGLERIGSFENRKGLKINRVVAPPHGGFSLKAMKMFSVYGFEGACISWGSIWSSNRDIPWTIGLGGDCGKLINGLGIIPRFRLSTDMKNHILLTAYLHQPIIPVGHHWDIREGPDILVQAADFINSLGEIIWCDVGSICRSNYLWKVEDGKLFLKPMSRVVDVLLPKDLEFDSIQVVLSPAIWSDLWVSDYWLEARDASGKGVATIKESEEKWIIPASIQHYHVKLEVKSSFPKVDTEIGKSFLFI